MFKLSQTKCLELEISSYCNAACPQCPRNLQGGKTVPHLPLTNWTTKQVEHMIKQFEGVDLEMIYFCGTYGDPMMNKDIIEICNIIKKYQTNVKIGVHTNGGLQNPKLYEKLAYTVDFCAFGIDGLSETNHLYRKKVSWKKLMENTHAFIEQGGYAIWDFIVFAHNQHQVEIARQTANKLGFKEFNVKKTSRFITRQHKVTSSIDVFDDQQNKEYEIATPTDKQYLNPSHIDLSKMDSESFTNYLKTTKISCNACRINEIYIGSDGLVFPCGWLHDRLYCHHARQHSDYQKLMHLFDSIGGIDRANIFKTDIKSIVDETWFPCIETQWENNSIQRCALMCGSGVNIIGGQNQDISYKI